MRPLFGAAAAFALSLSGCVKEISSDERLDRETAGSAASEALDADQLARVNCKDVDEALANAHSESRSEADRVLLYIELYKSLQKRTEQFDESMRRNPDLSFKEGSQELVKARDLCVEKYADVRMDFDKYVRDLVDFAVVDEVRGGATVKVARLDLEVLRKGINALAPADQDLLLQRVANAEKKLGLSTSQPAEGAGGKKR
ncbi:MAG: hypothetical protein RL653_3346 [Pseudomonadota bacterium]|jgi:hypothetical protein